VPVHGRTLGASSICGRDGREIDGEDGPYGRCSLAGPGDGYAGCAGLRPRPGSRISQYWPCSRGRHLGHQSLGRGAIPPPSFRLTPVRSPVCPAVLPVRCGSRRAGRRLRGAARVLSSAGLLSAGLLRSTGEL